MSTKFIVNSSILTRTEIFGAWTNSTTNDAARDGRISII